MNETARHFVANEPTNLAPTEAELPDPRLAQARLRVQTIQRFQALNLAIDDIADRQGRIAARAKLGTLAEREYGKTWEALRWPGVEVTPIMICGKSKDELKAALSASGYQLDGHIEQMLDSPDFVTLSQPVPVNLVRLKVIDLGFDISATTDQLYGRAKKIGLELCPAEIGPWYRLQTPDQPTGQYVYVGMPPIADADTKPRVFYAGHDHGSRSLGGGLAYPDAKWSSGSRFLFRLPDSRTESDGATNE